MNSQSAQFWRCHLKKYASCSPVRLMEVCGTHTHAIARYNLRELLPGNVTLVSGPGCPVCVSGALFIEKIRHLLRQDVTVALFGDLLRIPGSSGTLRGEKNFRIVYSPADALTFALENPEKQIVFAAVGFAPTLSAAAALMSEVEERTPDNFSLLSDFKGIMPVLNKLIDDSDIAGFLLPGHVASVTGVNHFAALDRPGVVSGFEAENILHSIALLLEAIFNGKKNHLFNNYPEAVRDGGNPLAEKLISRYFRPAPGFWRGLGEIPGSRMALKEAFARYDAEKRYDLSRVSAAENPECRCGEVLTGKCLPENCPLFGTVCTPENPAGACMASAEGSCAAAFQWQKQEVSNE
jgi:hydrogenase expression/formation protein HypD